MRRVGRSRRRRGRRFSFGISVVHPSRRRVHLELLRTYRSIYGVKVTREDRTMLAAMADAIDAANRTAAALMRYGLHR